MVRPRSWRRLSANGADDSVMSLTLRPQRALVRRARRSAPPAAVPGGFPSRCSAKVIRSPMRQPPTAIASVSVLSAGARRSSPPNRQHRGCGGRSAHAAPAGSCRVSRASNRRPHRPGALPPVIPTRVGFLAWGLARRDAPAGAWSADCRPRALRLPAARLGSGSVGNPPEASSGTPSGTSGAMSPDSKLAASRSPNPARLRADSQRRARAHRFPTRASAISARSIRPRSVPRSRPASRSPTCRCRGVS
jgi:hypothetical protein